MKTEIKIVVKRKGHHEIYDEKKVYASVYTAALNCHYREKKSEMLAKKILAKINSWIRKRKRVASDEIREQVIYFLKHEDKDAALMYEHHLDIC